MAFAETWPQHAYRTAPAYMPVQPAITPVVQGITVTVNTAFAVIWSVARTVSYINHSG
jgi:hypothetical protein